MSASMVNSIAELEPQTKAKIRSTQILTSLPHLISELVQNSLDAGASHIEVGIDPVEWECWVRDDGQGISAEGMGMLGKGHEQGRYITSKKYNASTAESITFGFRGEALASAMELSCLEISSRTVRSRESWSVIIKGGEQLYLGPSIRWRRERSGSTVVARDVFYNVPVRRRSHPNSTRTLDMAKKELETLALVFPHVSFSLEHTDAGQKNRILTISRTTSSLAAFRALYGKTLVGRVEELNLCSEDLKLEGFISLDGSHSRGFANFYVNKHPMAFGDIQRAIEQCFATSAFDRTALSQQDWAHRTSRSPKKAERKPVYVLNLTISPTQVDNFVEPAKSMVRFQDMRQVLAFVLEVVNRFLNRNGIAPTQTQGVQASLGLSRKRPRNQSATERVHPSSRDKLVELPSCPSRDSSGYEELPTLPDGSGYFEWTDPSSGEAFLVDSATGNSFRNSQLLDQSTIASTENFSSREIQTSYVDRHWLKKDISVSAFHAEGTSKPPEWLVRAMQRNSTFGPTEQHVFSTRLVESGTRGQGSHTHTRANIKNAHSSNFFQSSKPTSNTFSANDLRNAQVVAQVDTKFIACLIQPLSCRPERILALVDQHAADERVRVERYLEKLCLGFLRGDKDQVQNNGSKQVLLTRMELEIVARPSVLDSFARWGLCIEVNVPTSQRGIATEEPEFVQVDVTAVPDVVASKLTTDRELSEFVKRMVTAAEKEEFACWPVPSIIQEGNTWVKALRYCPAPLVELVNSKACRGAIMFNDPLDQFQCERLMQQLSQTVFPFQCAHGRPSLLP